ncbi:hypothetical protein K4F52_009411 [Lecanicillium sp. MT-2017a]|nr:hypothetical protein K4F52_009411 [Lecanicillium sp. MT-2017a]
MRVSQNAFKTKRAGQMETAFVEYLINNFESSKAKLSSLSNVMENWVKLFLPPYPDLRIQHLSETEVRTQSNLSLEYWGQPVIVSVGGATDGADCASDAAPAMTEMQNL